jgi:hypothetical protein
MPSAHMGINNTETTGMYDMLMIIFCYTTPTELKV